MKAHLTETYEFSEEIELGCLHLTPVHIRVEQLRPYIAAHRHSNISYEIHYTAKGCGTAYAEEREFLVKPGTIYITGPGVVHTQISNTDDPILEYCLYLNCQRNTKSTSGLFSIFADTLFWFGEDDGQIGALFEQALTESRNPRPDTWIMTETLIKQIIIVLTRMYRQEVILHSEIHNSPIVTRAGLIPVIEDAFFYRYKDLTIQSLAEQLHLSVRQTQRLLKVHFGKTFSQKLSEARMAVASQFLENTDLSITSISEDLGFSSIEHFSSAFRRVIGCSPRKYRNAKHSIRKIKTTM